MHPQAYRAVARMARELGLDRGRPAPERWWGLDIGGVDVNGSARHWLSAVTHWHGLDVEAGPGVDIVADATSIPDMYPFREAYDVVLCTEVLEHVEDWPAVVRNAAWSLKPGGVLVLTCAGRGRTPHGARGARRPAPGEHYGNVESRDLQRELMRSFADWGISYNPKPGDLYAWGRVQG